MPRGGADLYLDLILSALPEAVRRAVEAWMPRYEYQSDFARRYVAEGMAEGIREALLRVPGRRGFALSPELQRKLEAEPSVERLERWLDLAVTAQSLADVFGDA